MFDTRSDSILFFSLSFSSIFITLEVKSIWDNLDPITTSQNNQFSVCSTHSNRLDSPVRVQNKSNMPHLSIAGPLLELHTKLVETLARLLNVVNGDRDMSEPAARISVSISIPLEVGVRFGAVVVGELEYACFDFLFEMRVGFQVV